MGFNGNERNGLFGFGFGSGLGRRFGEWSLDEIAEVLEMVLGKEEHVRLVASAQVPTINSRGDFYGKMCSKIPNRGCCGYRTNKQQPDSNLDAAQMEELRKVGIALIDLTEIEQVIELTEGLYLVSGYEPGIVDDLGPYWFLVIVPILMTGFKLAHTTENWTCNVAVSDRIPVENESYKCTIVKFDDAHRADFCATSVEFSEPVKSFGANVKLMTGVRGSGMTAEALLVVLP